MKNILILSIFLASCGFFKTNSNIDEETTEAPPIVRYEKDPTKVLYGSDSTVDFPNDPDEDNDVEVCDYEELLLVERQTIGVAVAKNIWYTKKKTITKSYNFEEFKRTNHLHIKDASLKSVEGNNLFFLKWMTSEIGNTSAVWSDELYDPASPRIAQLNYNGSHDFAPALRPKDDLVYVEFDGEARGRSPDAETKLELHLLLASFYNCR